MPRRRSKGHGPRLLAVLLVLAACRRAELPESTNSGHGEPPSPAGRIFTMGDVEPDNPVKRTRQIRPVADYLAANLEELGIAEVRILIARSVEEMAHHLREGTVDVYIDSPFPVLGARAQCDAQVILHRWWQGSREEYWSVFITRHASGITELSQLQGRVIALESDTSTSGFLLPVTHLAGRGFTIRQVTRAEADVAADEIGFIFSGDEENSMAMVLGGIVPAGAVSNEDYDELPPAHGAKVHVLERTESAPRQLVAVRPGLEPALVERIRASLLVSTNIESRQGSSGDSPAGRRWEYGELTPEIESVLKWLEEQMAALAKERLH